MHPQPTEIPELPQQPLLQSSLQRQHSMTRSADPETVDVSFTPSKVSMTIFSSPIMTMARPVSDVTWITKTTWVLKALPSQTSSLSSLAPIVAPSARVSKLGGIEAPRVLSVIASAFLAHRLEDSTSDSDEEAQFMLSINRASDDAASTSTFVPRSVVRRSISQNFAGSLRPRNEKCNPGARSCEVSGQSPVFFICDESGTLVSASCVSNTVCYQSDDTILCSAPKGNIVEEHKQIAMF
ncbi:hypothetical protein GGI24_002993 [Coemansia furcata]|nr:hypothetical protein GGI24_002993 [Coemansia furcata]